MFKLVFSPARVFDFVSKRVPLIPCAGLQGIGLERDGELIGGTVYESFNGVNILMHCAGTPGTNWMTRTFLIACFRYPFVQLGCSRVTAFVEAKNTAACKLDEHLGFKLEATMKNAASDGGDVLIYAMRREDFIYANSL